ncbi:MAG: hypothetical protein ACI8QC_001511 [Planctomycetota bacterium]|jgi:hypothetical protein
MTANSSRPAGSERAPLVDLGERVASAARLALAEAIASGQMGSWGRPVAQGYSDVTFALDAATEAAVDLWLLERARLGPLSIFTEDAGWRHMGPGASSGADPEPKTLPDFDHGGPRIIIDPVDGTRHLMFDLRPAWCVIGQAGPGRGTPQLAELEHAVLAELPDTRAAIGRRMAASRGAGAILWSVDAEGQPLDSEAPLRTDSDDRPDYGYFPFYGYHPDVRAGIQSLAGAFFERLAEHEQADVAHCYDDQYIASGGQLALLCLGTYRMICDPRPLVAARRGRATQTAKPYDLAGAVLIAREAGAVVLDLNGDDLNVPLDGSTEVGFAAFANPATRTKLWPHLNATLKP